MRTFFLDKQDIVKITGERFYKRGYDYYQKGRVFGLSYNPAINSWRAQVSGTETYSVRIFFFDEDELEGSCDCLAYASHYTCKHIAAVLLAIGQDSWKKLSNQTKTQDKRTQATSDTFATRILDAFKDQERSHQVEKQTLLVEYIISTRTNPHNAKVFLEVELKLGTDQTIQIKNIRDFLTHVKKEMPYKIGASFTYQPTSHHFQADDQQAIHSLITAYENEALFESSLSNPLHDKRTMIIPPGLATIFLEQISKLSCSYKGNDGDVTDRVAISEHVEPLHFKIDQQDEKSFTIDISQFSNYTYLDSYGYLLKDGTFYQVEQTQQAVMGQLYAVLPYQTKQTQTISKDKMEAFLTNVIPKLEKIGKIDYTEKTRETITIAPLTPKIYLEEEKNALLAKVAFHYGQKVVQPYQKESTDDDVIKRDYLKEEEILQTLQQAGFIYLNHQFQLFKNQAIYHFLHETLQELQEHAHVYVSDRVHAMIGTNQPTLVPSINLNRSSGMLDIDFDIAGVAQGDVQHVLEAMIEKKQFYRIPNGALLSLEDASFESFQQLAEQLQLSKKQIETAQLQVPAARSFQVEEVLSHANYSTSFEDLLQQLKHPESLAFSLPTTIRADLRDYQEVGYQWFKTLSHYHLGGILADDMGLGKTLQTITFLLSEIEEKDHFKALVVAPASLLYNWKKEFEKFAPQVKTAVIIGSKQKRRKTMEEVEADVYITSYPLLRKDVELYDQHLFHTLILDEAQAVKNHLTLTAKAVRSIHASQRFALSGTPIENSLDELWSLFYTISPGLFDNKKAFLTLEPDYIAKITRPFILRRVKKDVLHELPDKIETVNYSKLTKDQKEVYIAYVEKMQEQLNETIETKGFEKGKLEILAGLTRLRQICCHPSLFLENYAGQSGKLDQLKELMAELKQNGKRTLIFSQFSSMLSLLNKTLQEEGYDTFYLDGTTPADKRMDMVDAFNEGEKTAFLISLKAGGTGLNLTGADTVILYDLWWNPAIEEQAAGRAHRIGQKNVVQVIRMITEGTIEEKIYELQQQKRELVDQIIKPGETMLSTLSVEEIRELLQVKR